MSDSSPSPVSHHTFCRHKLDDRYGKCIGEIQVGQSGARAGDDDAVATGALGLVESVVGELEEEIDAIGGFVESSHADGDGQGNVGLTVVLGAIFLEALADFLGAHGRLEREHSGRMRANSSPP